MTRFLVSSFSLLSKNRLIMCKPFLFLGRYSIICCAIIHYILPSECTTSSRATLTSFSFLSYSSSKLDDLPPFGVSAGDEFSYGVTTPYLPSLTRSISRNSANRSIFFRSTTEAMMLEGSNGVGDDDEEGRFLGGRGGRVCTSGVIDDLLSSSSFFLSSSSFAKEEVAKTSFDLDVLEDGDARVCAGAPSDARGRAGRGACACGCMRVGVRAHMWCPDRCRRMSPAGWGSSAGWQL